MALLSSAVPKGCQPGLGLADHKFVSMTTGPGSEMPVVPPSMLKKGEHRNGNCVCASSPAMYLCALYGLHVHTCMV